jgi:hypothetical protein
VCDPSVAVSFFVLCHVDVIFSPAIPVGCCSFAGYLG